MKPTTYSFSEKRPEGQWKGYAALKEAKENPFSDFNRQCKALAEELLAVYEESPKEISHSEKSPDEKVKAIIAKLDREKFGNADQRKAFSSMISYLNSLDTAEARKVIKHLGDAMTGYNGDGKKDDEKKEESLQEAVKETRPGWGPFIPGRPTDDPEKGELYLAYVDFKDLSSQERKNDYRKTPEYAVVRYAGFETTMFREHKAFLVDPWDTSRQDRVPISFPYNTVWYSIKGVKEDPDQRGIFPESRKKPMTGWMKFVEQQKQAVLAEAKKKIDLPDTLYALVGFGKDTNGNAVVKIHNGKTNKVFSIQTNGNLPKTHSMRGTDIKRLSDKELKTIAKEVKDYVKEFGSPKMESRNPLENITVVETIIDLLDARHRGQAREAKKYISDLKKMLKGSFESVLLHYGDPDRDGFDKVYDKWRDHLLSLG